MDLARVFMELRPNAKFTDDRVNLHSLDKIAETYIGVDLPTQQQCDDKWLELTAEISKEKARHALQSTRDKALSTMTHDFGDGRVIRTAPQDEANIKRRIDKNQTKRWVMIDHTVAIVTPTELQAALDAGITAGEQIWDGYMTALEAL